MSQSSPVEEDIWKEYVFDFTADSEMSYLIVEAFYNMPTLFPYNGHILLDAMSQIYEIKCE